MKTRTLLSVVLGGMLAAAAVSAEAQSLGEVARREAERRAKLREAASTKVVTNDDLKSTLTPRATPPPAKAAPQTAKTAEAAKTDKAKEAAKTEADPAAAAKAAAAEVDPHAELMKVRPEAHWRERAKTIRDRLERIRGDIAGLESRVDSIRELQQTAQGSAATSLAADLEIANKDLERFRTELRLMQDEWTKLEDAARVAKIPADWIR